MSSALGACDQLGWETAARAQTAAVSANSKDGEAGKAFIAFLTTPNARAVFKAKGLDPEASATN